MNEEQAIRKVQKGDARAFERLVDTHVRRLRAFVALNVPVAHLIDEVAHEAFVFAFENIGDFDPETDFHAWLRAIAGNLIRAEMTRYAREQANKARYLERRLAQIGMERSSEEQSSRLELLERCLERIPPRLRSLLNEKYACDRSTTELASHFKRSSAWIRTTLFRARERLRECVDSREAGARA